MNANTNNKNMNMNINNKNTNTNNITRNMTNMSLEAIKYEELIDSKNASFLAALDEYKTSYVKYNTSPNVQDYNTNFMNSQEQLQILSNDMFQITKTLQGKIEEKSKSIAAIAIKLGQEKKIAKQLEPIIDNLNSVNAGSAVMIDDSKTDYRFNYYKNVEIFMGIILLLALLVNPKAAGGILLLFIIYKLSIFQQLMKLMGKIF